MTSLTERWIASVNLDRRKFYSLVIRFYERCIDLLQVLIDDAKLK